MIRIISQFTSLWCIDAPMKDLVGVDVDGFDFPSIAECDCMYRVYTYKSSISAFSRDDNIFWLEHPY